MTTLDRFESQFRAAFKERFRYHDVPLDVVMVVTDLEREASEAFAAAIEPRFERLGASHWEIVPREDYSSVSDLLARVDAMGPDMICTYRNLYTRDKRWPYSLGTFLDVLTQVTVMPVLVVPHPRGEGTPWAEGPIETVVVVTDHVAGNDSLIDMGLRMLPAGGRLVLAHIEDDQIFARYIEAISKIDTIETEMAREAIAGVLLQEARDYIASCREEIARQELSVGEVVGVVRMGHQVADFRELLEGYDADMAIFSVKDEDQLAMHGLAYPLAVEVRELPLLMV